MKNLSAPKGPFRLLLSISILCVLTRDLAAQEVREGTWKGKEIEYLDGQVCVKVREGVTRGDIVQLAGTISATVGDGPDALRWTLLRLPSEADVFSMIDSLVESPLIESCEPHVAGYALSEFDPNDEYFAAYQWNLYNRGDICAVYDCCIPGEDINVRKAWGITLGSVSIPIAVLDSGIPLSEDSLELDHPDLWDEERIILGEDFVYPYYTPETDHSVKDWRGHGTQVAGIIGAETDNGEGIAGVAGGCKLQIHQVIASDNGVLGDLAFKDAVMAAIDPPYNARVINLSAAFDVELDPVEDAIAYAEANGVLVVVAADDNPGNIGWPAEYSGPYSNVIAVGPAACTGCPNEQSQVSEKLSVLAPSGGADYECGSDVDAYVLTTHPSYISGGSIDGIYKFQSGSSWGSAHVSGIAGLVLSVNPSLEPFEVREIIERAADDKGEPGKDDVYGWGSANAYQAVLLSLAYGAQSHSENATANNGQRKLLRESDGTLHQAFESGGEIYYRNSTTGGTSWEETIRISSGTEDNSSVCIAERSGKVYAVWQKPTDTSEENPPP